ncbi:MAG: glycoside hydrolase family 3 C-terminal domain-containing protein [Clostridia bacterium]|nr:glycoside hydrolase family 3 C-terminal domain-containing protein [Clostridia bacterium]
MPDKIKSRVDTLISNMSLRAKIGQLNQPETPTENNIEEFKEAVRRGEVGSILMSVGATAGNDAQGEINVDFYNELQKIAVEESPDGIPILFGRDVIHGHRTVFPIPLAMAASFNPELIKKCYRDTAIEATNDGVHWTFTPMLDLCRDPRWGRIIEGTGEDPYIGARIAEAVVAGLQGDDVSNKDSMLACAKHFIGYGASEGGRDYHRTEISDYSLYNYYLPAFRAAIKSGAMTVMSSFNDISGQPITSSRKYLTDILRNNLGFDGFVVSDYDAVIQLIKQGVAENSEECASMALNAGLDMDMHDGCYMDNLEKAVNSGAVSVDVIDEAVRRILTVKMKAGLFEHPYTKKIKLNRTEHLKDAREMAGESIVLLKNNDVLPINKSAKVGLIGPFSHERRSLLGSWTIDGKADETPTLAERMREVIGGNLNCISSSTLGWNSVNKNIAAADVVVLALGESWSATGESRAVSDITISSEQKELIKKAKTYGKKTVGVLFCGRPIAIEEIAEDLDAVLYAWHTGSEAAGAVSDILFGDVQPCGRLPVTLPRKATHIPLYYNVTSSGRPVNCYYGENPGNCYIDSMPTPYYPFGYGLTYTTFKYSDIKTDISKIAVSELKAGKKLRVSVNVTNKGTVSGKETVQLYIRDVCASIMRPIRELKAFKKIRIAPGKAENVTFDIGYEELGFFDDKGNYIVENGKVELYIGENCLTGKKTSIEIV